ncbi:DUF930 domain-containing protein [Brucella pseudogrignonensis]|uniref:DUF930 domain-containing protein n=1 Tax=Brucella pseudogrignonensis TaxID=419475 RepID=UPI00178C3B96|nr:DUF930 domain-containing protein [Brucella pseudogrignonensis]
MQQFLTRIFVKPGWGAPVSILFHLALAVLVFYRLPAIPLPEPDPNVNVELVDPPIHEPDKPKPEEAPKSQPQAFESASQDVRKMEPTQSPPTPTEASDNEVDQKKSDNDHRRDPPLRPTNDTDQVNLPRQQPVLSARSQSETTSAPADPQRANSEAVIPTPLQKPAKLKPAQQIYAKDTLADPRIKQALGKLPKRDRMLQICGIEALEQVRHQRRNTFPDMLAPSGGTVSGNSFSVRNGAFRSRARWYAIDFDCQLDDKAMQITQFSYAIGAEIPPAQWRARELPLQ